MPIPRFALLAAALIVVCTLPLRPAAADQPRRYDDHVVVRVPIETPAQRQQLLAIGGDVWSEHAGRGQIDVMVTPAQRAALDELGLPYRVWLRDLQPLIDAQRTAAGRTWFESYHRYDEIITYLEDLAAAHPTLARIITIGTTVEGRPIHCLHIAAPDLDPLAPGVAYFCAVHAREWVTTTVVPYFATHLLSNYGIDPAITDLVDHVEFFLVPVGNPDGFEYSWDHDRMWRKNRRDNGDGDFGVDINRNWGYQWGGVGASDNPGAGNYHGPHSFSEPETRALRDLFINHPNIRTQNDIHSYSQLLLWPWGFTPELPPDQVDYLAVGTQMRDLIYAVHGKLYDIGPIYTTIYAVSGGSCDWTYGARDVFSMSFELRDTGSYGFLLPPAQIIPNNEEILPALLLQAGCDPVRASQIHFPAGLPANLYAGADYTIMTAATSGVESLDPNTVTLHYRYDPDGPFIALPMTPLSNAAFEATLPATHCASQPEFYASVAGPSGVITNPPGAPTEVYTATMLSGDVIYAEDLSSDPNWTTEGAWAWGQPSGQGGLHGEPDPETGHTDLYVYGYNLDGDYTNNTPVQYLTSTPIDCTGQWGLRLSFWRWLGVERPPYDHATVEISNDGATWHLLWENEATIEDDEWTLQDFDIAPFADNQPAVFLRWGMGPTDSGWAYCGWNIDDIQIYATACVGIPGDYNGDDLIGWADFVALADCLAGPAAGIAPGCGILDLDDDLDLDLKDVALQQQAFTGP